MATQILEHLFDSTTKVRLLRLFYRNPESDFSIQEIKKKIKCDRNSIVSQIKKLENIKLIKRIGPKKGFKKVRFKINSQFSFYNELKSLVLKSSPASKERIIKNLKKIGRVKLAILAGIFINEDNKRVDMLIVGEHLSQGRLERFFKELEAEVGREIEYVLLTTEEFKYRYNMFDRFIRDVLEKPHEKLINKLRI